MKLTADPAEVDKVFKRGASKEAMKPKLDAAFNNFIRARDFNFNKMLGKCISCGLWIMWGEEWQAGHYHPKGGNWESVRWDFFNVHGQCEQCNIHKRANLILYKPRLLIKIGQKEYDALIIRKNKPAGFSAFEIACMIVHYRREFLTLTKNKL